MKKAASYGADSLLLLFFVLLFAFLVLQIVFGVDSTRTLQLSNLVKIVGLGGFAPVALAVLCFDFFFGYFADSPDSLRARLSRRYPNGWIAMGIGRAALIVGCSLLFAFQLCAAISPALGGELREVAVSVERIRDNREVFGRERWHVNCAEYIYLRTSSQRFSLCHRRRGEHSPRLSVRCLSPGEEALLHTRTNVLGTYVEAIVPS